MAGSSTRVESLLVLSVVMLAVLLFVESRAAEPVIPLELYRNPVIAVCAVAAFTLGVGMFGYDHLSPALHAGCPRRIGHAVGQPADAAPDGRSMTGSIVGGQTVSRTGSYKVISVLGSVVIAIGMVLFARMGEDTVRSYVVVAMVVAGVGMGLLQPVYTIAVQNVAPINRMGAATSSTIFFRSIGSTVGVAAFGSIMLTRYHDSSPGPFQPVCPRPRFRTSRIRCS